MKILLTLIYILTLIRNICCKYITASPGQLYLYILMQTGLLLALIVAKTNLRLRKCQILIKYVFL